MFPLRIRSHYSLMRGTMSCDDICVRAKSYGFSGLALTDRDNLYGLWPFVHACERNGLRPVIGAEVSDPETAKMLTCLVKNETGYANLCRLLTDRHCKKNFCLSESVREYQQGMIVLCGDTLFSQDLIDGGMEVIADLGASPNAGAKMLRDWAISKGVRCCATYDCGVAGAQDADLYFLLRAIDENSGFADARERYCDEVRGFVPPQVIEDRFSIWPEALVESERIAEECQFRRPVFNVVMPPWQGKEEAAKMLRKAAFLGAQRRYGLDLGEEVVERLEYELKVIEEMGFSSYFLVVRDIVHPRGKGGKRTKRRICGRGSGAASLVAYCLEITNVCPLKYNLYFERFLNPGRTDPPDIDIDFSWDERDDVITEVLAKYRGYAAMVSSHVLFQSRMAIRETAKAYGIPGYEISQISKKIHIRSSGAGDLYEIMRKSPTLRGADLGGPWREIVDHASRLVGIPRYLSVHPGGLVITPETISSYVPVEYAPKGVPLIQWEKDGAENAGLVKIDLLGNRSLGVIRDCIASLGKGGRDLMSRRWEPENDPATKATVAAGKTMGCFYIESPAMRLLQKKAGSGDYEQLVLQSSLIRPAANEFVREYVRRLHGGAWQHLHERLGPVLDETYGLMVYQEDVSRVAVELANMSHAGGDGLRKVMSKKDKGRRLIDYRDEFFSGCRKNGIEEERVEDVWRMMMSFSGYSFCKPHSASYARVSFQAAYLKTHFPAEFMAAVISNQGGYYSAFAYVSEAKRLGVKVLPPDVNKSERNWSGKKGILRVGLEAVKGLSYALMDTIVGQRKENGTYKNTYDFFVRTKPQEDEAAALIHAGALDSLQQKKNRAVLLWDLNRFLQEEGKRGLYAAFFASLA